MKRVLYIFCFFLVSLSRAQEGFYINNNAYFHLDSGATLYTKGDVILKDGGAFENNGTVNVYEGRLTNGNWINNSGGTSFIGESNGLVDLLGINQKIEGNSKSVFNRLQLSNFETILYQHIDIIDSLNLKDSELKLNSHLCHLQNDNTASLSWNTGYISGDTIGGYFLRSTQSTNVYRFPVGSASLNAIYRAVDLRPSTSDSAVYGVRLAHTDASFDFTGSSITGQTGPYDRDSKNSALSDINPRFYHHVAGIYGAVPAEATVYFLDQDQIPEEFNSIAQWSANKWNYVNSDLQEQLIGLPDIGSPKNSVTWTKNDFTSDVFALTSAENGGAFIPQIFSPNSDGFNDVLFVQGRNISNLTFIIYDRWGTKIFESNDQSKGWDGNYQGSPSLSGVYVYYVEASINGEAERQSKKGNFTLVR